MCAIIGVLGPNLPGREQFTKARDTMTHRGPDDAGLYYAPEEGAALGHRRLSIIDLSPAGRQPFTSNDGRYVLTYNGEIYNYKELKDELKCFYDFKTQTDTEVLLASYMKWKEKCLDKLNGMFAFAIWDRKKRELFCARDRAGVKPLYYTLVGGFFAFSSEIKGLLELGAERKLNVQTFLDYLSYRYPLGENTFFKGIFSLPPGHYATISGSGKVEKREYWDIPGKGAGEDAHESEILESVKKLLTRSVRYRLISDVPVGAYLSGGLDSSIIVALMAELSDRRVKTFSIGFPDDKYNELGYAKSVAHYLETEHHEITLDSGGYFDLLEDVVRYKDAPLAVPNEIPIYVLSRELRKHITVVLSGEGADELFGGYGRIMRSGYDYLRMRRLAEDQAFLDEAKRRVLEENLMRAYGRVDYESPLDHFLEQYSYCSPDEKKQLVAERLFHDENRLLNRDYFASHHVRVADRHPSEQYIRLFQKIHLPGLLGRLDTPTMAASVEGRVPFADDHELIEFVSRLPLQYKMRWRSAEDKNKASLLASGEISEIHDTTKYLLRRIGAEYLPRDIVERKKVGFPVPLDEWFEGKYGNMARNMLLGKEARSAPLYRREVLERIVAVDAPKARNTGLMPWMLLNFEIWMREYNIEI